jgi:hypothetical protein
MSTGTFINPNNTYVLNLNDFTFSIKNNDDNGIISLKNSNSLNFLSEHINNLKQRFPNSESKINMVNIISYEFTIDKPLFKDDINNYIYSNKQYLFIFYLLTKKTNSKIFFVYFSKNFNFPNFQVIGGSPDKINYIIKEINNNDLYIETDGAYGPVITYSNDINFINKYNIEKKNTENSNINNNTKILIFILILILILILIFILYYFLGNRNLDNNIEKNIKQL